MYGLYVTGKWVKQAIAEIKNLAAEDGVLAPLVRADVEGTDAVFCVWHGEGRVPLMMLQANDKGLFDIKAAQLFVNAYATMVQTNGRIVQGVRVHPAQMGMPGGRLH